MQRLKASAIAATTTLAIAAVMSIVVLFTMLHFAEGALNAETMKSTMIDAAIVIVCGVVESVMLLLMSLFAIRAAMRQSVRQR